MNSGPTTIVLQRIIAVPSQALSSTDGYNARIQILAKSNHQSYCSLGPKRNRPRDCLSYAVSPLTPSYNLRVAQSVNVLNNLQKLKFDQTYVSSIPVLNKLPSHRRVDSIPDSPPAINLCKAERGHGRVCDTLEKC